MTDAELRGLLGRLRERDLKALSELYTELSKPVYTVLLRVTRDPWLAEDLLQDFFLRLWAAPPEERVKKPRAYLFQTARNLALDALRRERRTLPLEDCGPLAYAAPRSGKSGSGAGPGRPPRGGTADRDPPPERRPEVPGAGLPAGALRRRGLRPLPPGLEDPPRQSERRMTR